MIKKILYLLLIQLYCCVNLIKGQSNCTNTNTTCLSQDVQHVTNETYWNKSHGVLYAGSNSNKTSPTSSKSLSLSSSSGQGTGAYTCYKFEKNETYRVCFWVRNNSGGWPPNVWGRLYVNAANGLQDFGSSGTLPSVSKQLIDQSFYGPPSSSFDPNTGASEWEFVSTTFTAYDDYTSLWFYVINPMGAPPPGPGGWNINYVVEVDDIRVMKEVAPYNITSTLTKQTINGCNDATTITLSGMPTGTVAQWFPRPSVNPQNADSSVVIAQPCSTTVYRVEITDPGTCATCIREVINVTVNVNQWSEASRIIYPTTVVPCLSTLNLDYNDPGTCPQIGFNDYIWVSPNNTQYIGRSVSIPGVQSAANGEWTLKIYNSVKGCFEEHKFPITMGSCCVSTPSFLVTGTNPFTFTNTSTGIINHVGTVWSFGDGTTSDDYSPTHVYNITKDEVMTVCLTMLYKDDLGFTCCNRVCTTFVVKAPSCAVNTDFTYAPLAGSPNSFSFTDNSTGTGTLCQFDWEFYDLPPIPVVTTTLTPTANYTFLSPGPWYVCLTTTNCWWDPIRQITVRCSTKKCMWIQPSSTPPPPMNSKDSLNKLNISKNTFNNNILTVFENPNHGEFSLTLSNREGNFNVVVRDQLGREVYSQNRNFGKEPVKINLSEIPPGIYTVEVFRDNERYIQQMSIIR